MDPVTVEEIVVGLISLAIKLVGLAKVKSKLDAWDLVEAAAETEAEQKFGPRP